ncbi:MAG: helix-turn-helix transcriptional regulator [Lachnospiraceae bacterium]|nr:helix-turn-helix transcriptional regulator [Lachnospiraceae bacterium]
MYEMDKEQFGCFLQQLRKEKGYTQKELAARLFISDKAVSKWERGLSLPDPTLLIPISEILDVTVTELLKGQRLEKSQPLQMEEVERLVTGSLELSAEEAKMQTAARKTWKMAFLGSTLLTGAELLLLVLFRQTLLSIANLWMGIGMGIFFGAYFCFFAKEKLPRYYDENPISSYSDGIFRMNLAGMRFNNSNWPHILKAGRLWLLISTPLLPAVYWILSFWVPEPLADTIGFANLPLLLGMFIPMIIAAKKYE